jgi:hypothetical protein
MLSAKVHRYIFLFGLFALAFGMMVGTVPTSVPQIILMANWLLEGDFRRKWSALKSNRLFWTLSAVFIAHVLGLIYTSDIQAGLNDVRTKMPLMFLPMLLLSSRPLEKKETDALLWSFVAGCVVNTLWCCIYTFILHHNEVQRNASRFMSHIRLGLYLNMGIATCVYFYLRAEARQRKILCITISIYLLFMMYLLGLASGLANFFIMSFAGLCLLMLRKSRRLRLISVFGLIFIIGLAAIYLTAIHRSQVEVNDAPNNRPAVYSAGNNPYIHFDRSGQKENGNYVLINIQLEELQRCWKREFPADSFHYGANHNLARYDVLVRYMASLGLMKDSVGYLQLSEEDKSNIQKGVTNYLYPEWSFLHKRSYELVNEYDEFVNKRNPNGHSLTMRMYFWKAGIQVLKANPVIGTGTGDVQAELNKVYVESHSPLERLWYKRPHNQFLTIAVALGIIGLLIFLHSLLYPVISLRKYLPALYYPFMILALSSFILEDTLETQAGLTFFAFFNSVFLSEAWFRKQQIPEDRLVSH